MTDRQPAVRATAGPGEKGHARPAAGRSPAGAGQQARGRLPLPDRARVIIIGGGVIGTSVAYHLTRLGWPDVLLLERGQLSCGTTWHAAGLVGQLRASESVTRLVQYSTGLYRRLEDETGLSAGFRQCGGVTVARTAERMGQLRRTAAAAAAYGLDCELIGPARALDLYPVMRTDDLAGALWLPGDGTANPTDLTYALAKGARMRGARVRERTPVTGILAAGGAVTGVRTAGGDIEAEVVVNCAGQWAKQVGAMCGVNVPMHSAEHFYVVTERIDGVRPDLPVLRDPDGYTYFKEEVGGLVVGGFEPQAKPWLAPDALPADFEFRLLPEDWDQFSILMENGLLRIPALSHAGIKKFYNGPESFTPDNQFILGEAPELRNFFVAAGFNSVGIASAGGAGRALAEWIAGGEPATDLSSVDLRRFARFHGNNQWLHDRVGEVLGLHYAVPWPNRELGTARPFRRSPVYHLLKEANACFGSKMGWERANFFAPPGERPRDPLRLGQAELAALVGGRAAGGPGRRRGLRPDLVLQVPAGRPGCGGGAAVAVHRRHRGAARPDGLYRDAQLTRHLRGGHHRHPAVGNRVPAGQQRLADRARPGSHPPPDPVRRGRHPARRHLRLRRLRGHGAPVAGAPVLGVAQRLRRCDLPVRLQSGRRHRLRHRPGDPDHLRRGARLGTLRARRIRGRRL